MSKKKGKRQELSQPTGDGLFQRVAAILDQARGNVARSVNTNMVLAYWLIGREIVQELQGGDERAEYGKQVVENLSSRLTGRFGRGFSAQTLWNYRLFYQEYADRCPILSPAGRESTDVQKLFPAGRESQSAAVRQPTDSELAVPSAVDTAQGFSPQLSWSHYRALMRVSDIEARTFYEREAAECGWTKAQLERQIQSSYYQRIVANRGTAGLVAADRERLPGEPTPAEAILKTPYILKCFLLIDLKIGKLTHRDLGQVDGYVRLFEDCFKVPGDNPTIGLILCSDKSEAVAKYSVLSEGQQIFASKYLQFLPSEQELMAEIERQRKLIEAAIELAGGDEVREQEGV